MGVWSVNHVLEDRSRGLLADISMMLKVSNLELVAAERHLSLSGLHKMTGKEKYFT